MRTVGKGVPEWDADEVEICSRTGYGFYFLYGGLVWFSKVLLCGQVD